MTISFYNPGVIDIRAATVFGINAKETENPIGFFGTGLKYAIAVILRRGGSIKLYAGLDCYEFTSSTVKVRNKDFDVIEMNGQPLGFTTRLGINWEPWMAFRELMCNAMDEGGDCRRGVEEPAEGTTVIHVEGLDEVYGERHIIVLPQELTPLFEDKTIQAFAGPGVNVYCRGVRVYKFDKPTVYTYNFLDRLPLTEDRTLSHPYTAYMQLATSIGTATDKDFILSCIGAEDSMLEHEIDMVWNYKPSQEFLDVVAMRRRQVELPLNTSAYSLSMQHRPPEMDVAQFQLSDVQQAQFEKAIDFLDKIGFGVPTDNIFFVEDLGQSCLGKAMMLEKRMLISRRAFDMGTKYVAGTILEEHIHLARRLSDCTREMQNFLIDRLMTLGEQVAGEPL